MIDRQSSFVYYLWQQNYQMGEKKKQIPTTQAKKKNLREECKTLISDTLQRQTPKLHSHSNWHNWCRGKEDPSRDFSALHFRSITPPREKKDPATEVIQESPRQCWKQSKCFYPSHTAPRERMPVSHSHEEIETAMTTGIQPGISAINWACFKWITTLSQGSWSHGLMCPLLTPS